MGGPRGEEPKVRNTSGIGGRFPFGAPDWIKLKKLDGKKWKPTLMGTERKKKLRRGDLGGQREWQAPGCEEIAIRKGFMARCLLEGEGARPSWENEKKGIGQ